jgi:hypothetical protein
MLRRYWKLGLVAISCVAVGAGVSAIASAGAASTGGGKTAAKQQRGGLAGRSRLLRRAVHGELVVPTKSGLQTVTLDRGVVRSRSGDQLTLSDGTKKAAYKTVTLTIAAGARVRDNGKPATLADVKAGQAALVVQGPKQTLVVARDRRSH